MKKQDEPYELPISCNSCNRKDGCIENYDLCAMKCPIRKKHKKVHLKMQKKKDDTESLEMNLLDVMIDSWSKDNVPECVKTAIKEVIREKIRGKNCMDNKENPMKPNRHWFNKYLFKCGRCGKVLDIIEYTYCPGCGQKIDWSEYPTEEPHD